MKTSMSKRAYARSRRDRGLPGGTLSAVQKALSAGRIHAEPDGTIDAERADRDWEAATDPTRRRGVVSEPEPTTEAPPLVVAAPGPVVDPRRVELLSFLEPLNDPAGEADLAETFRDVHAKAIQSPALDWHDRLQLTELVNMVLAAACPTAPLIPAAPTPTKEKP